jgi:hypothetical protein
VLSFTEAHTACETVKFFFYVRRVRKRVWQNFLNLELMSFLVKRGVSTEQ